MCEEMIKLREYLDAVKIKWRDDSECLGTEWYMHRTKFEINGNEFSVINGVGSYGGAMIGGKNQGFLEMWINQKGEPEGYLTADDVIKAIKNVDN